MTPHKHAEIIKAWADGAEIETNDCGHWYLDKNPDWSDTRYSRRIKPPEVPQWHKDMAQALKDGKVVEYGLVSNWVPSLLKAEDFLSPLFTGDEKEYRIKPEPKPDVVRFYSLNISFELSRSRTNFDSKNLKLIWDGETGALKDAEVLK